MSSRYANTHKRCLTCKINKNLCFCDELYERENETPVLIIMHKAELELTTNTAYFSEKVIRKCDLAIRGVKGSPIEYDRIIDSNKYTPLYLFPDEDSVELNEQFVNSLDLPPYLIVPDGSWRQAKKCKRREPFLKEVQSVKLLKGEKSQYRLRTNPFEDAVCTYEAIARAIGVCDGEEIQKSLEKTFKVFTDRMYYSRFGLADLSDLDKFEK
ncbi:tRNA-uridine aminocarboxypropyltransferase [Halobacteriovorax sp. HLS]|uniref:tRNA-uridine aminocarboxypropyltransferase n=1 Tax=Halobacteriovorax sp. HLS TaxID=2234000 RepID=UPI000FD76D82|nr:tRNA-uridine aminocarboxypropyltransferase [Halobacteriovorax sp. HLS]